ncbi:RelA/SpoT family protein [Gallibacter intestinalis]|uniref:GTP diphosphokinase n=1 Tax=Gallibacter intestinalis TaxID=2779356 RepID=A0ABR9QXR8_9FIRM|nr:bifunctional (p)ppGpp synthetase/guanosine-3',5'-bis(diphosphate) 3'-pyrophosphohydrolase [Gallibacter intestinalis]MBE5035656.1 bifunctional (p)ppGpp synthetase/guanosine-3',5'-bis(diphosphate) 3'-pyrophosphohydrolase [Gallibacter intestinalis]
MQSRQEFLDEIIELNPKYDIELIGRAYDVAAKMHEGQLRKSGEPYLIHPMAVVKILAELGMDEDTLVAGLLHDVVEDTEYTNEQLRQEFGEEVELLVDGVTKIGSLQYENKEERQAETLRKMFLAMSKDIRVLIIKLADRLHNLRTINYMTPNKIVEKCSETLDIYAPLASRLGIYSIKFELEDICMRYLWPDEYQELTNEIHEKKEEREADLNRIIDEVNEALKDADIDYDIYGRTKHFYSIFRKMKYQNKQLDEIFDLMAVRIIVDTVKDCYAILGIVHSMWTPIPGRFKDYIAMPKPNMYQSLHTTVIGDTGDPFEIQIRTKEMHRIAEYGIAAHWKYKEGVSADQEEVKLSWLRQSLEWQKEMDNPKEFLETLKMDLFENQVFVFTPKGDVMELPAGSTPLDFAFKVHSEVGAKCVGAKINGKMVTIDHKLENGDIVEIVTSSNSSGPSIDWLKIVKSPTARTKIRQWLKKENKTDGVDKGKMLMDKYLRKKGYEPKDVLKNSFISKYVKDAGLKDADEMFLNVSPGGTVLTNVASKLISMYNAELEKASKKEDKKPEEITTVKTAGGKGGKKQNNKGVIVKGMDGLLVRLSKCCNPVPGDEIIGYITKGRGVSVHRKDCPNMVSLPEEEKERFIEVEWEQNAHESYEADITIIAEDRKGLFSDISKVCENAGTDITSVNARADKDGNATVALTVMISNIGQIGKLTLAMKSIEGVYEVFRSKV